MTSILLILSTMFGVIAPASYLVSIFRGNSKPHRTTRFVLLTVSTLNWLSIISAKGNAGAILIASIFFFQSILIFLLSIWRGMGGVSKFDMICLAIAIFGIIGWKITGNPTVGVAFAILADISAYLPAFVKTWKYPNTESPWFYAYSGLSSLLSLMAYKLEAVSAFQLYLILCSIVMLLCIYHTKILNKVQNRS